MTLATRAPQNAQDHVRRTAEGGRRRRCTRRVAIVLAAPLLVLGLAACDPTPHQESVRAHVNETRRAHGLHPLGDDVAVRIKAQAWAQRLADAGRLSHSSLRAGLDAVPWIGVAENVGYGSSIRAVHDQYLASSQHRANILDPRWDRVGTGHAVGAGGRVYTVQVFVDLR